ncbi:MAG: tryptophan synthase subunit alpha [Peptococcaceae bacterium BRH_c4b]|nr:MAG: tryptophan synthase subunit alpha [Peptococcaceae bacterium BRH_c4b]
MENNRITRKFNELREKKEKGLIAYITSGDPDLAATVELAVAIAEAGADLIELGIPFSDPVADGPVIQQASQRALERGVRLSGIIDAAAGIRKKTDLPLIFMTYYNPVLQYGLDRFVDHSAAAGIDGLIVPDLPLEEAGPLLNCCRQNGLALIPLVAPTTTPHRLEKICKEADGFVYCVSVTGVTGVKEIDTDIAKFTSGVRKYTDIPLALGFGISSPELAANMARHCDAVVVGSAIVKIISQTNGSVDMLPAVSKLVADIKNALTVPVN